ncbi:MAG: carboxypeptidase-like regulatory domain-containing protein [Candidatus Acidiferrum sp.]
MTWLAALTLTVSACAATTDACVFVNGWETKPSSKNAEVLLLLNGKPQANARLTVISASPTGWRFIATGPDGTAMLEDLSRGITCVTATDQKELFAALCLRVSAQSESSVSQFRMSLTPTPPHTSSLYARVQELKESPPALTVRSLRGTVMDPVGAVIPKAEVQVYKRDSYPHSPVKILSTNETGEFSDLLEPGIYTVIVRASGFAAECLAVEIRRDDKECELRQILDVEVMVN